MSYPGICEPTTRDEAISVLQDAMDYIARTYGGTLAHHTLAVVQKQVKLERFKARYPKDRSLN